MAAWQRVDLWSLHGHTGTVVTFGPISLSAESHARIIAAPRSGTRTSQAVAETTAAPPRSLLQVWEIKCHFRVSRVADLLSNQSCHILFKLSSLGRLPASPICEPASTREPICCRVITLARRYTSEKARHTREQQPASSHFAQ